MLETEMILKNTRFNSYEELFYEVYCNKTVIKLTTKACLKISSNMDPVISNMGSHFGFIPSAILIIGYAIYSTNYLLLLLLPIAFIFPYIIFILKKFNARKSSIVGCVLYCTLALFFFCRPISFILLSSWIFSYWSVNWWQKKTYKMSIKLLQHYETLFVWAYNSCNLLIDDNGTKYIKPIREFVLPDIPEHIFVSFKLNKRDFYI